MDGANNGIVLYHYSFSPVARRVLWYLSLRGIDYAECVRISLKPNIPFWLTVSSYRNNHQPFRDPT
jgi:hypothetical protein